MLCVPLTKPGIRPCFYLLLLLSTTDCAMQGLETASSMAGAKTSVMTQTQLLAGAPQTPSYERQTGNLIVYSATYAPTLEQSEYPAHTDYTIATPDDNVIKHVKNATGSFGSRPAIVPLLPGQYYVRAQYDRGVFAVISVVIELGKDTVLDLNGEPLPQGSHEVKDVHLPDGNIVGWRAMVD
jgi:hypothetical protein